VVAPRTAEPIPAAPALDEGRADQSLPEHLFQHLPRLRHMLCPRTLKISAEVSAYLLGASEPGFCPAIERAELSAQTVPTTSLRLEGLDPDAFPSLRFVDCPALARGVVASVPICLVTDFASSRRPFCSVLLRA
jgi:hypothetical protein